MQQGNEVFVGREVLTYRSGTSVTLTVATLVVSVRAGSLIFFCNLTEMRPGPEVVLASEVT